MKFYLSDKDGNEPQDGHLKVYSFSGQLQIDCEPQFVKLPAPATAKIIRRTLSPTKEEWLKMVAIAKSSGIQKVVLGRQCILELESTPDPFAIAATLKQHSLGASLFCFSDGNKAFLGATPENLFSRTGNSITTEAIAGTRRRGQNPQEDERLSQELLQSAKDHSEFLPVKDYLHNILLPLCTHPLQFTPTAVHKTKNVQHLYAQGSSKLKKIDDTALLKALHPTPALSGVPKEEAQLLIKTLEPMDRGLFGGVLGLYTPEKADYMVAIRCCLLEGARATLFSGAGIVDASSAEAEWDELDQKIKLYDKVFI